jgi:hypothetical protein
VSPVPAPRRTAATRDRRSTARFSLSTPATYNIGRSHGTAVTCDISTGGVFLKTEQPLPTRRRIRLLIDWPAKLDRGFQLQLAAEGTVLRSTAEGAAVKLSAYDYRLSQQGR